METNTTITNESKRLTAYNMKTKEKKVPMHNVVINKITNGNRVSYAASGTSQDGVYKLATMLSATNADEAINAGVAARGTGWD